MVRCKQTIDEPARCDNLVQRLQMAKSPEIARTIGKFWKKYGKFAVPVTELRKNLDKEMGDKTLTEELYAMREGR